MSLFWWFIFIVIIVGVLDAQRKSEKVKTDPEPEDNPKQGKDNLSKDNKMARQTIVRTTRGANDPQIRELLSEGWRVKTTHSQAQGYDPGKTCCLGCLFFPLALLGRKKDIVEYVLEKDESEKGTRKKKDD